MMLRGGEEGGSLLSPSIRVGPKLLLVFFYSGRQNDVGKIMANNSRRGKGGKAKRETEKKFFFPRGGETRKLDRKAEVAYYFDAREVWGIKLAAAMIEAENENILQKKCVPICERCDVRAIFFTSPFSRLVRKKPT